MDERTPLPITNQKIWDMALEIVDKIKWANNNPNPTLKDVNFKEVEGDWFDWIEENLFGEQP